MGDFVHFHKNVKGTQLFERYHPAHDYIQQAEKDQLWFEKRELRSAPLIEANIKDPQGSSYQGLNFASNNYLGLANHPFTVEAGIEAAKEFGVNSAGSPLAFGATKYFKLHVGILPSSRTKSDSFWTPPASSFHRAGSPASVL